MPRETKFFMVGLVFPMEKTFTKSANRKNIRCKLYVVNIVKTEKLPYKGEAFGPFNRESHFQKISW